MDQKLYQTYLNILKEELKVAMGCTEPIAIAYASALVKDTLKEKPYKIKLVVS